MIKVSAVAYLNTKPFIYGLEHHSIKHLIDLSLDIPSVCAAKLIEQKVDIGLIPVAVIHQVPAARIITNKCIGSQGKVRTVNLYSLVPLEQIKKIWIDPESKTSVLLTRVLCRDHWNIDPQWEQAPSDYTEKISGTTAAIVIGDRTFSLQGKFPFVYDLSEAWFEMTGLPFVFACWVTNKELDPEFESSFSEAISFGIEHKENAILEWVQKTSADVNLDKYLKEEIQYELTESRIKALELFLDLSKNIQV